MPLRFRPSKKLSSPSSENIHPPATPHPTPLNHPEAYATVPTSSVLEAWQDSRRTTPQKYGPRAADTSEDTPYLRSGTPRPLTIHTIRIAAFLLWQCWLDIAHIVLTLHPVRMPIMVILHIIRGVLPAFQSHSQASILNEIQRLITTGNLWANRDNTNPLLRLILIESLRMLFVKLLDTYVEHNATTVQQSVRLHFQYLQLQNRLKLDIPALADPLVQDLLDESNRFVNSFASGGNTILTPLGLVSVLADITQAISQCYILYHILRQPTISSHLVTILAVALPRFPFILRRFQNWIAPEDDWPDEKFELKAASIKRRIAQMENMAYNVTYKAEVVLFGLADWVLAQWLDAKREDQELDQMVNSRGVFAANPSSRTSAAFRAFLSEGFLEVSDILRQLPFLVQYTHSSLGSVNLARTATERLCNSARSIKSCVRWSFDAAFDLGAFHCAMTMRPYLKAKKGVKVPYPSTRDPHGQRGMKIELKNLEFTFPGHKQPTLRGVDLSIEPGETVAIVGLNGSGKTTCLHVLARLVDFSSGSYRINGVDARHFDASDLHDHTSAIFQSFCKFESTSVRENIGVGNVQHIHSNEAVLAALRGSGAASFVDGLAMGLNTPLDVEGMGVGGQGYAYHRHHYDHPPPPYVTSSSLQPYNSSDPEPDTPTVSKRTGAARLSGGQWQRIAISRALMRADSYDLMLVDEANSALDLRGQRELFQNLVRRPNHGTIIYVTHRLEALRWADKIALMEDGRITAFGSRDETRADIRRVFGLKEDADV